MARAEAGNCMAVAISVDSPGNTAVPPHSLAGLECQKISGISTRKCLQDIAKFYFPFASYLLTLQEYPRGMGMLLAIFLSVFARNEAEGRGRVSMIKIRQK
ncbi:hypothetical protein K0M31_002458 [Melipona bicolor]|uniref:Uncharacterized protein n=1 Tax=Melipona bicolor TaxID=60889 RepID=A0AA40GHQ4_9HYME|nr:hypothetical protein K0M31_002458 [Melipona bicolor]